MTCKSTYCECDDIDRAACDERLTHAEMRALYADPVPPSGGEPECGVCHDSGVLPGLGKAVTKCSYCGSGWRTIALAEAELRLVDQKEITRLQAEVFELRTALQVANKNTRQVMAQRDALQAELTKAREALEKIASWPDGGNSYGQGRIKAFAIRILSGTEIGAAADIANQSAPADKE